MFLHLTPLDDTSTRVATLDLRFDAIIGYMLVHGVEHETYATVKKASDLPEHAFMSGMPFHIFAKNETTDAPIVRALEKRELTDLQVPLLIAPLHLHLAARVWTLRLKLHDKSSDWNIGLEGAYHSHVA